MFSDVRRAALLHIPVLVTTLPAILLRTRDTDATIRKLVYSAVLEPNVMQSDDSIKAMGVTHPRALSIAQRELIVRNGLGDREGGVKAAAGAVVGSWVDAVGQRDGDDEGELKLEMQVVRFLTLFDLAENKIAEDALLSVFESRPDVFDHLEFDGNVVSLIVCVYSG
jgi:condensin complex subunit 3